MPLTLAGLPLGTMRVGTLVANSVRSPTSFCSTALFMVGSSAVARTSAALPSDNELTRV